MMGGEDKDIHARQQRRDVFSYPEEDHIPLNTQGRAGILHLQSEISVADQEQTSVGTTHEHLGEHFQKPLMVLRWMEPTYVSNDEVVLQTELIAHGASEGRVELEPFYINRVRNDASPIGRAVHALQRKARAPESDVRNESEWPDGHCLHAFLR